MNVNPLLSYGRIVIGGNLVATLKNMIITNEIVLIISSWLKKNNTSVDRYRKTVHAHTKEIFVSI